MIDIENQYLENRSKKHKEEVDVKSPHSYNFIPTGCRNFEGGRIRYRMFNLRGSNENALLCKDAFSALTIDKQIVKHGYKRLNRKLKKLGLDAEQCLIKNGNVVSYITVNAYLTLLDSYKMSKEKAYIKSALLDVFLKDVSSGIVMKKKMESPVKRQFLSPISVYSTPKKLKTHGHVKKKLTLKTEKAKSLTSMKTVLQDLCQREFDGDKKRLIQGISTVIKHNDKRPAKGDNSNSKSFDGTFSHQDIFDLLKTVMVNQEMDRDKVCFIML